MTTPEEKETTHKSLDWPDARGYGSIDIANEGPIAADVCDAIATVLERYGVHLSVHMSGIEINVQKSNCIDSILSIDEDKDCCTRRGHFYPADLKRKAKRLRGEADD